MESLGSSSGGIQWNSTSKYIQILSSDGSTWVNWSYYNPQTPVSLIPTDIDSDSYTRTDGVRINLIGSQTVVGTRYLYICFKHSGDYSQMYAPCTMTIQFSVPQVIISFEYYNYPSNSTTHVINVSRSIDGATYENLGDFTGSGVNSAKNNISISNPAACKFIRFECASGNFSSSNSLIFINATLYGYSYSA